MLTKINYTLCSLTEKNLLKILFIFYKVIGLAPVYVKKYPAKLEEENFKEKTLLVCETSTPALIYNFFLLVLYWALDFYFNLILPRLDYLNKSIITSSIDIGIILLILLSVNLYVSIVNSQSMRSISLSKWN